jgi:hypothetical protein
MNRFQDDPQIFQKILWSDEVIIELSAYINKHIYVYWDMLIPYFTMKTQPN